MRSETRNLCLTLTIFSLSVCVILWCSSVAMIMNTFSVLLCCLQLSSCTWCCHFYSFIIMMYWNKKRWDELECGEWVGLYYYFRQYFQPGDFIFNCKLNSPKCTNASSQHKVIFMQSYHGNRFDCRHFAHLHIRLFPGIQTCLCISHSLCHALLIKE